jgi:hypothetical protein
MSAYKNSNLLYRPSISIWTARKKDKAATLELTQDKGAVSSAANVHKNLLPDSKELEAVQKWATSYRTWIYEQTLPWDDSGWRIGRVLRHMDFMAESGDRMREGDTLVDTFLQAYAAEIEQAKFTLNSMFNPSDYPGVNEVRSKFSFSLDVSPLPNCEDFRVVDGVPADEVTRLVGIAEHAVEDRVAAAMKEAYTRLHTVVAKMAGTLRQYDNKEIKKFNDTLVTNIADLVAVIPALNVTGDPALDALAKEAARLVDYDPSDLRNDELSRKAAQQDAQSLAAKFADMLN